MHYTVVYFSRGVLYTDCHTRLKGVCSYTSSHTVPGTWYATETGCVGDPVTYLFVAETAPKLHGVEGHILLILADCAERQLEQRLHVSLHNTKKKKKNRKRQEKKTERKSVQKQVNS